MDFVRIYNLSKILHNKDYDLGMKPSYKENLAHERQIWDVYQQPHSNLDVFLQHSDEYKVFKRSHCVMKYSLVFYFNY
jgi:hypothetical protein